MLLETYLIVVTNTDALDLGADVVYYLSEHCCHFVPVRSTEHMSHDRDLCDQAIVQSQPLVTRHPDTVLLSLSVQYPVTQTVPRYEHRLLKT